MLTENVKQWIAERRSIKPALMDPSKEVSEGLWSELFECANWAPSHGHTEPWRFIVFRGEARGQLAAGLQTAYKAETAGAYFKEEKWLKMGKNPLCAHAVVAIVMKREEKQRIPEVEEVEAVACAVQNFHLAASSVGLGAFWSSPAVTYGQSFARFLELGDADRCLGLLYVGWPKEGDEWPTSKRGSALQKVTFR